MQSCVVFLLMCGNNDGRRAQQNVYMMQCVQALEEAFPESTPLLPKDLQAAAAVKEFCDWYDFQSSTLSSNGPKNGCVHEHLPTALYNVSCSM
jgi:hypothetical protein